VTRLVVATPLYARRLGEFLDAYAGRGATRFLDRLEANQLFTGDAGRPGPPFEEPSLILTGRQDSTVGYRGAGELLDELPRATYAVVDLAGHHLGRIERPALFTALVADWLERMTG